MTVALAFHITLSAVATSLAGGLCYYLPPTVVFMAWSQGRPTEEWPGLRKNSVRAAVLLFAVIAAAIWWRW